MLVRTNFIVSYQKINVLYDLYKFSILTGGSKDENKSGEDEKMEESKEEENEEAKASEDKPATQAVPKSQQDSGSKDQVKICFFKSKFIIFPNTRTHAEQL